MNRGKVVWARFVIALLKSGLVLEILDFVLLGLALKFSPVAIVSLALDLVGKSIICPGELYLVSDLKYMVSCYRR